MNKDYEAYKFTPEEISFSTGICLRMWVAGVGGRRDFLRSFCHNTGIEYPPNRGVRHHLPDNYIAKHDQIVYLGKIRDHIILARYSRYIQLQQSVDQTLMTVQASLASEKQYAREQKEVLSKLREKLRRTTDSSDKLWLKDNIASQKAKIENQNEVIDNMELKVKTLCDIQKQNKKNWIKQLEIIDSAMLITAKKFINNINKKVRKQLNFTKFTFIPPDHTKSVLEIIKGEGHA